MSIISDNFKRVSDGVAEAAVRAKRNVSDIELIAVTKFVETERITEAIEAGARSVGENRAQELRDKLEFFEKFQLHVHLIGQLQTNKVKYAVGKVDYIQSVDRLELAREIDRLAVKDGLVQNVLVEVNIGGEEQKGGVGVDELDRFFEDISAMQGLRVKGLMCIPPAVGETEVHRYFAAMRELFTKHKGNEYPNVSMEQLSMGMSGDFMAAIEEGATMVRVGTAIFGARKHI